MNLQKCVWCSWKCVACVVWSGVEDMCEVGMEVGMEVGLAVDW